MKKRSTALPILANEIAIRDQVVEDMQATSSDCDLVKMWIGQRGKCEEIVGNVFRCKPSAEGE
jgi:hypothetical protein